MLSPSDVGLTRSDSRSQSNPAGGLALPPPLGRNAAGSCGSGCKYKRCGCEQDEIIRGPLRPVGLPLWLLHSRGKLQQFEKYAGNVLDRPGLLARQSDSRRAPEIPTFDVVNRLFHGAVLRIPSLHALEGDRKESDFQKLIGCPPTPQVKRFSADGVANGLDKLHLPGLQGALEPVIQKAERNKAFREGSYGGLRCVAVDGWEPFASQDRHCPQCRVRSVKAKRTGGEVEEVPQYYPRQVVALRLGPVMDVVLAIAPVLHEEARTDTVGEHACHQGELTAAHRLLDSLHPTYGSFLDAIVVHALYAHGRWMSQLDAYGYGGFIVLKKENHQPFQEALALGQGSGPVEIDHDPQSQEQIEFWDEDDIETLDRYAGKIRVIRAGITKSGPAPSTWGFAILGQRARPVSRRTALKITRSRWHFENTAFHPWIQHCNLGHGFRHSSNALLATLRIGTLAFNLLPRFIYRRRKPPRRPKDPTYTIPHIVEIRLREIATLPQPLPGRALGDSS